MLSVRDFDFTPVNAKAVSHQHRLVTVAVNSFNGNFKFIHRLTSLKAFDFRTGKYPVSHINPGRFRLLFYPQEAAGRRRTKSMNGSPAAMRRGIKMTWKGELNITIL